MSYDRLVQVSVPLSSPFPFSHDHRPHAQKDYSIIYFNIPFSLLARCIRPSIGPTVSVQYLSHLRVTLTGQLGDLSEVQQWQFHACRIIFFCGEFEGYRLERGGLYQRILSPMHRTWKDVVQKNGSRLLLLMVYRLFLGTERVC